MKKRILVTGGFGMIGRRLSEQIKNSKNSLMVVDNFSSKLKPVKGVKFSKTNILNEKSLLKIFKTFKPNIVVHLAAIHHIPTCEKKRSFSQKVNILGTEILLKYCEIFKVKKFVLASSGAVYNWQKQKLSENITKLDPSDNYSMCKFSNEVQLKLWTQRTLGTGIVARIFNTIGYDDPNSHLLPDILKQIDLNRKINRITLGNMKPKRDYVDADDVASALNKMINYKKAGYSIFNICCGKEYSVKDIINILEKILKIKIFTKSINSKKRKIDRLSQLGSNTKIKNKLKWSAKLNLISTLQKYIYERKKYIF